MTYQFHEEQLAVPYRVEFLIPYEDMRKKFDEYWEKKSDKLISKYKPKVKKSKGGQINKEKAKAMLEKSVPVSILYQDAISAFLTDLLKEKGKDVLHLEALQIFDYEPEKEVQLLGQLYYYPELVLNADAVLEFTAKMPKERGEEHAWQGRTVELKSKYRKVGETEHTEGPVLMTHELLVDVIASVDGQPYQGGTVRGQWFEINKMFPDFRDSFKDRQIGDLFETTFNMGGIDEETKGKTVHATIKIFKAHDITYREIDDQLAKDEGFESLDKMKEAFHTEYERHLMGIKKGVAAEAIANHILQNSVIPPLPNRWTELNTERLINQHIKQFQNNKEKAMSVVGAKDDEELSHLFRGEVFRDILRTLAIKWYVKHYELTGKDDETLYADMIGRVKWEEEKKEEVQNG